MITGRWISGKSDGFEEAANLRIEVFCDEQGISKESELDELDEIAAHALVYDENKMPVATGRLHPAADSWRIGRICVKKANRGKGYADMVLRMLLDRASHTAPDADITLHAQLHAVPVYEKFGFKKEGAEFVEDGLPHIAMRVNGRKIDWHRPCGH